ncbi:hypothetical protein [Labrenzia sp. CE80]|uniref:hypothetical protein n=1 Tax=Labrenzia sp. CE80 TaxID=1788986 RepID=UPI00129B5D75|nr:hypothetical protein [Labrenzia sp. CE80]
MKILTALTLSALAISSLTAAADQMSHQPGTSEEVFSTATLRGSIGLRYWHSKASTDVRGALARMKADDATGQTVELVAALEDVPSSTYFKGYLGFGKSSDGSQSIRGVKANSWNTTDIGYVTLDGGWEVMKFAGGAARLKTFVGYQFLSDDFSANYTGSSVKGSSRWHALRLGLSADGALTDRFGWSVDAAVVPWSYNEFSDTFTDIESEYTYGFEADAMMNIALTSNWDIGVGGRYWWLHSEYELDQNQTYQRYGLLLESKYNF